MNISKKGNSHRILHYEKVKIVQIGVCHEHAEGKILSLRRLADIFEIVGFVNDNSFSQTPKLGGKNLAAYEGLLELTLDEALNYPGIQAATIEVPNNELVPMALRCAERNLALHMDKPAGEDIALYGKLLDKCREKKLPFQMGFMFRGNPAFSFCTDAVKSGMIGDVYEIILDMNHGYGGDEYQKYIGCFKGGIMYNLGCHLIDFVVSAMGEPENVVPFLKSTPEQPPQVKNNTMAVLEYPYANAIIRCCSRHPENGVNARRVWIAGTKGTIEFSPVERFDGKPVEMELYLKEPFESYPAGRQTISFPPQSDRYEKQLIELAEVINKERNSSYSLEHDYLVHKVTLAAAKYIKWSK